MRRFIVALAWLLIAAVLPAVASPAAGLTTAQQATIAGLREVNYYPSAAGWSYMWTQFNPTQIDADFAQLHALGANTVRIIVQPDVVGYPTVDPVMANRLLTVGQLAGKHGLHVHLTLFDWWSRYTDIAGSKQWVSSLLAPYKGNTLLSIVEVHNELDATNTAAVAWAKQIIPYVRSVVPGVMVTVSCSGIPPAAFSVFVNNLKSAKPSFWDYHYYGTGYWIHSVLQQIKTIAGATPLIIGETGQTTIGTDGVETAALDQSQADFYQAAFAATKALSLPDVAPWILFDFAPGAIPPGQTADDPRQYGFGLYRADGTPKPSAAVVSEAFHS